MYTVFTLQDVYTIQQCLCSSCSFVTYTVQPGSGAEAQTVRVAMRRAALMMGEVVIFRGIEARVW